MNYRALETVYDAKQFDKASDMWSFGCILAELFRRKPLFQASTKMEHQFLYIF